jgi:hypothetical protein
MSANERQRKHRASVGARLEALLSAIEAELTTVRAQLARLGRAELPEPEKASLTDDRTPLHSRG